METNARAPQCVVSPCDKAVSAAKVPRALGEKGPRESPRKQQQNDDEDDVGDRDGNRVYAKQDDKDDEWSDADSDDDAHSYTSNQTEDEDDDNDSTLRDDDHDEDNDSEGSDRDETEAERQENDCEDVHVKRGEEKKEDKVLAFVKTKTQPPPLAVNRPVVASKPVPALLSVPAGDSNKKGIQEPRPPRGSGLSVAAGNALNNTTKAENKKLRQKFQFPDAELIKLVLEEEDTANAMKYSPSASGSRFAAAAQRRRFSSTAAVMGTTLSLRRKSFTLTKGPIKPHTTPAAMPSMPPPPSPAPSSRFQARRKSTSACYSSRSGFKSPQFNKNLVSSLPPLPRPASASRLTGAGVLLSPSTSSASSQMVVRVRERKSDGRPELVISKRPARFLVWNWNDRQVRIPFNIQLGPHQHGVMLRQLRYVKSVMNDFPWAKTHLKDLLAAYTKKDMTKDELYPQLNMLSHQVQQEIGFQVKKQKQIMVKKQRLTMQLSLATGVINEMHVTKYGRRGKPHDTKLYYDPGQPTKLQWIRKNGDRSSESLEVNLIEIHCYDADSKESELSAGIKKAMKKFSQTASLECCVSLVTPLRTLDLQLKSSMHREWLMNALCDVISFARQYRAAGVRRDNAAQQPSHSLRRM